jgi:hypothetical protein
LYKRANVSTSASYQSKRERWKKANARPRRRRKESNGARPVPIALTNQASLYRIKRARGPAGEGDEEGQTNKK